MHAGLARISKEVAHVISLAPGPAFEVVTGTVLANGIAAAVELGHVVLKGKDVFDDRNLAKDFFEDNIVIENPQNGVPLYQGRFLIRTAKPGDDLNVLVCFCPDPDAVYRDDGSVNAGRVVDARALTEDEADAIEGDPNQVDLVIRFKDAASIVSLLGEDDVDAVGLLLDNLVTLTGNAGHLFKIGAIAADIVRIAKL